MAFCEDAHLVYFVYLVYIKASLRSTNSANVTSLANKTSYLSPVTRHGPSSLDPCPMPHDPCPNFCLPPYKNSLADDNNYDVCVHTGIVYRRKEIQA